MGNRTLSFSIMIVCVATCVYAATAYNAAKTRDAQHATLLASLAGLEKTLELHDGRIDALAHQLANSLTRIQEHTAGRVTTADTSGEAPAAPLLAPAGADHLAAALHSIATTQPHDVDSLALAIPQDVWDAHELRPEYAYCQVWPDYYAWVTMRDRDHEYIDVNADPLLYQCARELLAVHAQQCAFMANFAITQALQGNGRFVREQLTEGGSHVRIPGGWIALDGATYNQMLVEDEFLALKSDQERIREAYQLNERHNIRGVGYSGVPLDP